MNITDVPGLFNEPIERFFHVTTADYKVEKRRCVLCGPVLEIHDVEKITTDIYLYLPIWNITTKEKKKHSTIYLNEKFGSMRTIKFKSKHHEAIHEWFSKFISAQLVVHDNVFESAHFITAATIGSSGTCKASLDMTVDTIKASDDTGILFEVRRGENLLVSTTEDGQEKILIQHHDNKATFRFKDSLTYRTALVILSSTPPEPKYEDQITLDDVSVPELNLSLTDLMANAAVSQKGIADKILAKASIKSMNRISSTNSCSDIFQEKVAVGAAGKVIDETDPETVIARCQNRYKNIIKTIQIQEENSIEGTLDEILSTFPKHHMEKHPFDMYDINADFPDSPTLQVADPIFNEDKVIMYPRDIISLATPFPLDLAVERLKGAGVEKVPKVKEIPSPTENILTVIGNTDWADRPRSATGIFLNGLAVPLEELSKQLMKVEFSVVEISIITRTSPFQKLADVYNYIVQLFSANLVYSFFTALDAADHFKRSCFNVDALVMAPGFCASVAPLFDAAVAQPNKMGELPFISECAPYVIAADAVARLKTNRHTDNVETEGEDTGALADIVFPVAYCAGGGARTVLRDIYANAKDGKYKALQNVQGNTPEERSVSFIVGLAIEQELVSYLLSFCGTFPALNQVIVLTAAELSDCSQYVLLADQSQFLEEVSPYILRRFQALSRTN